MNKSIASREIILESAKEIAKIYGIENLSIRKLANKCEVSVGTIYNYFPSKSDIILEIVSDFWMNVIEENKLDLFSEESFINSYEALYSNLYDIFLMFRMDFLSYLTNMNQGDRKQGQKFEKDFFVIMKQKILIIINNDRDINEKIWNETFTKELFTDFVIINTISMLKSGQSDCIFFKEIIIKLLYE